MTTERLATATSLATALLLTTGSVLGAAPDDGRFGGFQPPRTGAIVVGNPADLPEEEGKKFKFDGVEGESCDMDRDGRLDEGDLEFMFDRLGSNDATCDLDGNGSVDGDDMTTLFATITFGRLLPLPGADGAWPDDWTIPW